MTKPDEHYLAIIESMDEEIELESARVKEAIEDTMRARIQVEKALDEMEGTG